MIVCIFSFNRGNFLQHCVDSIERCAPDWKICVMDDDSNDPETKKILANIEQKHQVIINKKMTGKKHGGLYANMQMALETFCNEDLLLCLQDDMQLVRHITKADQEFIQAYFKNNPSAAFIQPCFLKGSSRKRDQHSLHFCEQRRLYFRESKGQSAGVHYSDILITCPAKLRAANWQFADSEPANDSQAAKLFGKMGHLFCPIAMWLPEVPAYRGKRKTLALKIAERRRQCGLFPFNYLTEIEQNKLQQRSPSELPFAEDFLTNSESGLDKPWVYYPLQGSRWLKKLNSMELGLRRLTKR